MGKKSIARIFSCYKSGTDGDRKYATIFFLVPVPEPVLSGNIGPSSDITWGLDR